MSTNTKNLNDRIKEIRKVLNMSQKEVAKEMGISQGTVSWSEQPGNNVPESTIKSLCTLFNVNVNYLLYGELPMFVQSNTFSLDNFIKEKGGTDLEKEIIKTYFELDPLIRKAIIEHFKNSFLSSIPPTQILYEECPDSPEDLEKKYPPLNNEIKDIG